MKNRMENLVQRAQQKENRDFIMLPVVDFCFKELMKNPVVRKGFIAALLGLEPEQVEGTELLPNEQPGDYPDEKTGILDVLVRFREGGRINLEMQVLLYAYWRERVLFYLSRIYTNQIKQGGSYQNLKKEDFVKMAERDPYLKEAYEELERISADLEKRYEYEAREKALRDHISFLEDAKERGLREGLEKGLEKGLEQAARLFRSLLEEGRLEEMRRAVNDLEYQKKLMEQYGVQESLDN